MIYLKFNVGFYSTLKKYTIESMGVLCAVELCQDLGMQDIIFRGC